MREVIVKSSKTYSILIDEGILSQAGTYVKKFAAGETAVVITDDNVEPLYSKIVTDSLEKEGYTTLTYVIPNGEHSKNAQSYIQILNFMAVNKVTRSDVIIALGGGVVGDLTGFVAGTYLRGISFVQIPTTILAAVDSSVGGKTAIDLESGKNLAGVFYQPNLVLCDYRTMDTLTKEVYRDGCAEIIKYGVIADEELFKALNDPIEPQIADIIERCDQIKRDVVMEDECDNGIRQILNFGHTIGHAIEACSNYEIPHGTAVAQGMVAITRAAYKMGLCEKECYDRVLAMNQKYGFDLFIPFGIEELYEVMTSDKKRSGKTINLIMPIKIGEVILYKVTMDELKDVLIKALEDQ